MPAKKKTTSRSTRETRPARAQKRAVRKAPRVVKRSVTRRKRAPEAFDSDDLELISAEEIPQTGHSSEPVIPSEVAVVGQGTVDEAPIDVPPLNLETTVIRYPEDIFVAIVSVILAASPFLPWYKLSFIGGKPLTATGWATGTWGPMVAIFGALSAVLAILRIAGVHVKLPYPDATIHEGVGWIALIGTVIKFRAVPKGPNSNPIMSYHPLIFVAAAAALVLAMLAGRMSKVSPFAAVPGWLKGNAGKIGAALLTLAVAGSVAFGLANTVNPAQLAYGNAGTTGGINPNAGRVEGRFPDCASSFPRTPDAKPLAGAERPCSMSYQTSESLDQIIALYKAAFDKQGQHYKEITPPSSLSRGLQLTGPLCGQVYMVDQKATKKPNQVVMFTYKSPFPNCAPAPKPSQS